MKGLQDGVVIVIVLVIVIVIVIVIYASRMFPSSTHFAFANLFAKRAFWPKPAAVDGSVICPGTIGLARVDQQVYG
jgi:hypothetical protein